MSTKRTRRGEASSSSSHMEEEVDLTSRDQLEARGLGNVRLINDTPDLEILDMREEIQDLLTGIGWGGMMTFFEHSRSHSTYEVLDSFRLLRDRDGFDFMTEDGRRWEMPLSRLSEVFGWSPNGLRSVERGELIRIWPEVYVHPGREHGPGGEGRKVKYITRPAHFYIQRVLANSIFGRSSGAEKLNAVDELVLYAMHTMQPLDWGFLFTEKMRLTRTAVGKIFVGPFVTRMLKYLDIPLRGPTSQTKIVDIDFLKKTKCLTIENDEYVWFEARTSDTSLIHDQIEAQALGRPLYLQGIVPRQGGRRTLTDLTDEVNALAGRVHALEIGHSRITRHMRHRDEQDEMFRRAMGYTGYVQYDSEEEPIR